MAKRCANWLRAGWLGPLRLPAALAERLLHSARHLGAWARSWPCWIVLPIAIGALPVVLDYSLGLSTHRFVTALLLVPLLLAAVVRDWEMRGLAALSLAFVAHSALTIALAACDPVGLAPVCPGGADYWERSRAWITTGTSREYELSWWLPAHFQLLAAMLVFTYTSLGLVPIWQGLYEVDLMNFYVGRFLADADAPGLGLALGWHPWSVCRGAGYLFLTYEITSLSLARLTGSSLSTPGRRCRRWALGLMFLLLDGVVKYFCLGPVRDALARHLG
jgi:hypothetical protein